MDSDPKGDAELIPGGSPDALLEAVRRHPEWSDARRDAVLDRLITEFPGDRLRQAARGRVADLGAGDGEIVLRLVEAHATPELLRELAEAVQAQPGLPLERAWDALGLLEGEGMLEEFPELRERWEELNESLEEDGSIEELVAQLEGDPEGVWLALQGLNSVEPEVRVQILEGLAGLPLGPGLIEFLRLLSASPEPSTRGAALGLLEGGRADDPLLVAAWSAIALEHDDPDVVARARAWLGPSRGLSAQAADPGGLDRTAPRIVRSLVTALDGQGRGSIVLASRAGHTRSTAAFLCDVERGIREVVGQTEPEGPEADGTFEEIASAAGREVVEDAHELALSLLAGSLSLCGPETPPAVPYWVEAVAGPGVRARPVRPPFAGWDPSTAPFDEAVAGAEAVLAACPDWLDRSALTFELAEEIALREGDTAPDPRRDAGAFRYLFEHRLLAQLELFRRMLLWMASLWEASGDEPLGRWALALAWQLSDPQHAVPGHPFTVALTTRSLRAAQAALGSALDPRQRESRARGA